MSLLCYLSVRSLLLLSFQYLQVNNEVPHASFQFAIRKDEFWLVYGYEL